MMFETDDFDQVLSQFDFNDIPVNLKEPLETNKLCTERNPSENAIQSPPKSISLHNVVQIINKKPINVQENNEFNLPSPKHSKRKIINSYFDTKNKRKFPGPAGLLSGSLQDSSTDDICQIELLSQDLDFSQNLIRKDIFQSPVWNRLLQDVLSWKVGRIDHIKDIKQQALSGNLRKRKAKAIAAFVEAIDRSATDPLIILRDETGNIKCTLHRDAWACFSSYIASEYCIFILWKPTVLTTGGAFKKHYLNITLSNIFAIYSSTVISDENDVKPLPEGYNLIHQDEFTVIKIDQSHNVCNDDNIGNENESIDMPKDLFDGLDGSLFMDEDF